MKRILLAAIAAAAMIPAFAAPPATNGYPVRPVTMVVAFAPGGITDLVSREVGNGLTRSMGQSFVIENKAGAAGQLGTEYVSKRPADGYTLLVSASGHTMAPAQKKVNYHPVKDFAPIALLTEAPNLLVVHPSVPAQNLTQFLGWAKNEQVIPYATAGVGGANHMAGELFRNMSGLPLTHVPYRGAAPAAADVVAGQVKVSFLDVTTAAPFIASGRLRALAVTSKHPSNLYPNLPTIASAGFKGYDVSVWIGLYAPAGTPNDIVKRLSAEVRGVLTSPQFVAKAREQGNEPGRIFDADFGDFIAAEHAKWQDLIKTTGLKFED